MKKSTFSGKKMLSKIFLSFFSFLFIYSFTAAQFNPLPDTQRPGDGKGWLDNGNVKIAVNLNYGGAITYFSKSNSNVNTVNNFDKGRQAQLSLYSGPDNFSQNSPIPQWQVLGWNPIEGGDVQGNSPYVINYANNGTTIYTKVRPYFWPLVLQEAECYIEKWISLDGNAAKIHFRFTNFRSDQTIYSARNQEIPCLYSTIDYSQTVFYSGTQPFTNAGTTTVSSTPTGTFEHCSENWMAVQNGQGDAVALWGNNEFNFIRAKFGNGSNGGEFGGDANYIGISPSVVLDPNRAYDWDCALVGGTIQDIRNFASAQPRPPTLPDFTFSNSRLGFATYSMGDAGEPNGEWNLTVTNQSDWNISSPSTLYQSSQLPKIYIKAAFSLNNVTNMAIGWYRYGQGAGNVLDLNQYYTFPIINDGQYHTYEVTVSNHPNWTSAIKQLLVFRDPATTGNTTGTVKIQSISYQNTGCSAPAAPSISVTGQNTTTCSDGSRTVTISASGCSSGTINWSNGGTGSSINVTTAGNYTATCTVNSCTSSSSNTVALSNGTDCSGGSPNPSGDYEGHFDGASCDGLHGWVWLNNSNHRVIVEVVDGSNGDAVVAEATANNYRADLQAAGKGDGIHGFYINTPNAVKNGQPHQLKIRVKGINYTLINSPRTVTCSGCSAPSAPTLSITGQNTTTCSDGSRTVTIAASGCSGGTINWSNSQTGGSINVTAPGNFTATCTIAGCTSAASNTVSISNGSGCSGGSPNPSGDYEGFFDGANCDVFNGWVWLVNNNHRVIIEIVDGSNGDAVIGEMTADSYRSDLQAAGKGDGAHSFWFTTPNSVKDGQNHQIKVRVKGINFYLNYSPRTINCSGGSLMLDPSADADAMSRTGLHIFPNPANSSINIHYYLKKDGEVSVKLTDILGRTKQIHKIQGKAGKNQTVLPLKDGLTGIFFVETIMEGKRKVKTLLKK